MKAVTWIEKHKSEIELFQLSPYAPEYNSGEYINSGLKRGVDNRAMPCSGHDLEHNIRSHMKTVQLNRSKIQSFFQAPTTSYAAQSNV